MHGHNKFKTTVSNVSRHAAQIVGRHPKENDDIKGKILLAYLLIASIFLKLSVRLVHGPARVLVKSIPFHLSENETTDFCFSLFLRPCLVP